MVVRLNLKFVAAAALLSSVTGSALAQTAPASPDCVDCVSATRYDNALRPRTDQPTQPAYDDKQAPVIERRGEKHRADEAPANDCYDCPPPKKYDSQEVIKHTRDVDRSAVINTTTVVPVPPKIREKNHLVVHENQTRLVGTVQHNHLIVEKEIRYVRRRPPEVRYVKRVVRQPVYVLVPVQPPGCGGCGRGGLLQALAPHPAPMMVPVAPIQQEMVAVPQMVVPGCGNGYYSSCGMVLR